MLFSKLFPKPIKNGKKYDSPNATFLINGGFVDQVMAGVYTFLPLGQRVLSKIENIVRTEMDKIGQEMFMPSIVPTKIWEDTNRINTIDVLFQVNGANKLSQLRNDATYILNCTHEDVITPLSKKFNTSYKDFPFALYQIQTKFRNEPRAKSGIMRGREFRMKDLYSFHTSEKDLMRYYHEEAKPAYIEIFKKLGLGEQTVIALASGGDFTENFSHEFQTICESGEDTLFYSKKTDTYYNREVAPSKAPEFKDSDSNMKELQDVETVGVSGVSELVKHMNVPIEKTVKTMLYENDRDEIIAAAVRGDYDINENKLKKVTNSKKIWLASPEVVKSATGAEIGYAGLLNLSKEVIIVVDDSLENSKNFEMGANRTNYHSVNVNWERDLEKPEQFYDIKIAKEGDLDPEDGKEYNVFAAAEVGNIFPLNTKFSDALNYTFKDENGEQQIVYMGSYGIGTSRVMGVLVETFNDEKGIIWPMQVAPYHVHLIGIDLADEDIKKKAFDIYEKLQKEGIEVLFDDRDLSPGNKFGDADLIGIPVRLVVSKRTEGKIEFKMRSEKETELLGYDEVLKKIKKML
jgi:prolyl-tRNA synthetase